MKRFFAVALAAALCLAACKKDDTLMNSLDAMGDVSASTIYSDNGFTFKVTKVSCEEDFTSQSRIAFTCNVLKKVSNLEYEVELLGWNRVLKKDYLLSSSADEAAIGNDPIKITSIWASGYYLNIQIVCGIVPDSSTKHFINLVLDEAASTDDTLHFTLHHNGYGESVTAGGDLGFDDVVFARSYVSFPIQDLIPRGGSMNVVVDWDWYVTEDEVMTPHTETNSSTGIIHSVYSN